MNKPKQQRRPELDEKLIKDIEDHIGTNITKIAKRLDLPYRTVHRHMMKLKKEEKVIFSFFPYLPVKYSKKAGWIAQKTIDEQSLNPAVFYAKDVEKKADVKAQVEAKQKDNEKFLFEQFGNKANLADLLAKAILNIAFLNQKIKNQEEEIAYLRTRKGNICRS